jgi:hypothetical protein
MHKLRLTIGGVVAAAALALAPAIAQASTVNHTGGGTAASTASSLKLSSGQTARPAGDTYGKGYARVCNDTLCSKWQVEISYDVTFNGTNVWINGKPTCTEDGTKITWCGYGDNGQKTIGIGADFGNSGQFEARAYVNGNGTCSVSSDLGVAVYVTCP